MANSGWIKLWRQLQDHWIWKSPERFDKRSAWVDLMLLANHKEVKQMRGDKVITFKVGTVNRSIKSLARRWRWNEKTVTKYLKALESDGMVTVAGGTEGSTITIVNYSVFQFQGAQNGAQYGAPYGTPYGAPYGDKQEGIRIIKNDEETPDGAHITETEPDEADDEPEEQREHYTADPGHVEDLMAQLRNRMRGGE